MKTHNGTAVSVRNLVKEYPGVRAVDGISFDVCQGEIWGMVGPNGAGKTTTTECLEGLRRPDGGAIQVLGLDPTRDRYRLRERIGVQFQSAALPDRIRVWEALNLFAAFYRRSADWQPLLEQMGLAEKRDAYFAKLSGGQKQRLFIALALVNKPDPVFLDPRRASGGLWNTTGDARHRAKHLPLCAADPPGGFAEGAVDRRGMGRFRDRGSRTGRCRDGRSAGRSPDDPLGMRPWNAYEGSACDATF
jgi:ABC-type ATPase involved in cell division